MSSPLITVAMSVHNGEKTVRAAIHSVLWQTCVDWELIVVNDASIDETRLILQEFRDLRIQIINEPDQGGLAARLNQCVAQARGKYVARMDADDIAYPERFERQVHYLESHSDIDLLGHGAVLFKGDGQVVGTHPAASAHDEICRRPWWGFPLPHPTWMGKRSWFIQHRYDEAMAKGQDQALLLKSYQSSRFAALPEILLGYRMEGVSARKSRLGRLNYCRQLLRQVSDLASALIALRGMCIHCLAFSRDVFLEVTGGLSQRSRQSFQVAGDSVREQWYDIWRRIQSESCLSSTTVHRNNP